MLNAVAPFGSAPEVKVESKSWMTGAVSAISQWARFAPYVLAIFFMLWSLRGVTSAELYFADAPRHAMNGVYVHDLIRGGEFTAPIEYGKYYYSRLPALSLPYHPPLFPIIESLFFFVFGVNLPAARLAIAVAVLVCVLLFYRLVLVTSGSHALAIICVLTFFSFRLSQAVAADVMLEFPALAFLLAALYCLRDLGRGYSLRSGLWFALFAGAAVWTKQQTVFLGLVPFFYVLVSRRWRLLIDKTIWLSSTLFGLLVLILLSLSMRFNGTGSDQVSRGTGIVKIFLRNVGIYADFFREWFGLLPAVFIVAALAVFLFKPRRHEKHAAAPVDLYLAWASASLLFHLLIDAYETRYLFFTCPALVVVGYTALVCLCRRALPPARVWHIPAGVAILAVVFGLSGPANFLRGPAEAAAAVLTEKPRRVLYCGRTNGSFIFAVRGLDPQLRTIVIRGDKLPEDAFSPEGFERFARRYGINYVVLERTPARPRGWTMPWDRLRTSPTPSMVLEREIPLVSSVADLNGELRVYRFTNPSASPENSLSLPVTKINARLELKF